MSARRTLATGLALSLCLALLLSVSGCASMFGQQSANNGLSVSDKSVTSGSGAAAPPQTLASPAPGGVSSERAAGWSAAGKPGGSAPQAAVRMVIRNKTMMMEVKDAKAAEKALEKLAAAFGGYITDVSISSFEGSPPNPATELQAGGASQQQSSSGAVGPFTASAAAKIPAARFEAFLAQVRKLGRVESEQESQQDVTQQNVDLVARIHNLRAEEAQFVRFFDAAKNVREMLDIETQLARVRGEIEQSTAELDLLHQNVAMATLSITMHEPAPVVSSGNPQGWGVVKAFTQAIRNFVDVINLMIMATGALLPFVIILLAIVYVIRWSVRRSASQRRAAATAEAQPEEGEAAGADEDRGAGA
jgi:hypothetical protein